MPIPLRYSVREAGCDDIAVEQAADGGVTVRFPPAARTPFRRDAVSAGVGIALVVLSLGLAGAQPWRPPVLLGAVERFARSSPPLVLAILAVLAAAWAATIVVRLRRRGRPTVIAITAERLYVDVNEGLIGRRFEVPRCALEAIEVIRWPRSITQGPRCLQLHVRGRPPVMFCRHRSVKEILAVAQVLRAAEARTNPPTRP